VAKLTIDGVDPFDGVYELDFAEQPFTNRDVHLIKKIAGVRLGELAEAFEAGDNDLLVAVAVIQLRREGKVQKGREMDAAEILLDAVAGKLIYEDTAEDDAGPPERPLPNAPVGSGENDSNSKSSSPGSNGASDALPETIPTFTGPPA
jgi:hypothetical protein